MQGKVRSLTLVFLILSIPPVLAQAQSGSAPETSLTGGGPCGAYPTLRGGSPHGPCVHVEGHDYVPPFVYLSNVFPHGIPAGFDPGSFVREDEGEDKDKGKDEDKIERPATEALPLLPDRTFSLSTDQGSWMSVDVSPDGKTVLFDFLGDIYSVPLEGGDATQITEGLQFDAMPRYSPDGDKIVFMSDRSGGENIWEVELEKLAAAGQIEDDDDRYEAVDDAYKQITKGNDHSYVAPEYLPDGKYIVASRASGTFGPEQLWMFHVDGGDGIQLVKKPEQLRTIGAAPTPDGKHIWYAQRNGLWQYNAIFPQYQLGYYDRETGERYTRTFRYGSAFRPTISADGKWMVYGTRHETETGLVLRDMESGEERWLAYPVQHDDQESVASRDVLPGMSFTPDSGEVVATYGGKIWRIPLDGGDATEIPFRIDVELPVGPSVDFDYPIDDSPEFVARQIRDTVPSPDGSRMAFTVLDRLYVMDYPDGTPRRLTDAEIVEAMPIWSPDGNSIVYVTWSDEDGGHIYESDSNGGTPRRLTTASAIYTSPAYAPDGERIVAIRGPARVYHEATGPLSTCAARPSSPASSTLTLTCGPTGASTNPSRGCTPSTWRTASPPRAIRRRPRPTCSRTPTRSARVT